jgi:hypothetical protein
MSSMFYQEMSKSLLTHSSINLKHSIVICVSIYTSKCNVHHLNSGFNKLKVDDSTQVKMLIIKRCDEIH